ncbi:AAA family ATPase [Candidatus Woesearchaeota archaeon CG_4_10_14_0_2_um_filter_33_10]|nr:MAG: AAA family ATPase [Candidatus Woesearchaeota archaeon CG10_big_fil_rev_8_21_14_0_10_33_12]PIU72557.1 MAG: AAA family ATPase [Candidatus Woesearchaeota archaeon CG06_land_8_20_14_3_00_33_13]PIZ53863.1 MAG: AAA family ATPase [Candidatus Woesearchaeota archaeon CG_4_10_14_0_2_um_filter_33_10]
MEKYKETFDSLYKEIGKIVVGQKEVVEQIIITVLCDSNALLEGYPGLAKTLAIKTMAQLMDLKFSRIQNTPDLMPSDITGTYIIEETSGKRNFKFQPGPVFANIVLADEINRATPKTQSALLEAMQEKQVTVGNTTFKLDMPFFVLATQNPIEQEGTYPLPEAQADRFLLKIKIGYPSYDEEIEIVNKYAFELKDQKVRVLLNKEHLLHMQTLVRQVPIANDLKHRIVDIVTETRKRPNLIEYGASPRASIGLVLASKARAVVKGRNYVSKEDIDAMAYPILRHRIILNFEAERKGMSTDDAIKEILNKVK